MLMEVIVIRAEPHNQVIHLAVHGAESDFLLWSASALHSAASSHRARGHGALVVDDSDYGARHGSPRRPEIRTATMDSACFRRVHSARLDAYWVRVIVAQRGRLFLSR